MNIIFHILGIGLAGQISSLKKKYKADKSMFDYSRVFINISQHKGKFSYVASCICNDVFAQGLGNSPYISIFNRNRFKSQIETEKSIEKQVKFAKKRHKSTHFYLHKPIDHYEDGRLIENVWANYEYLNSKWIMIDDIPYNKICKNCGNKIQKSDKVICKCGEFIF